MLTIAHTVFALCISACLCSEIPSTSLGIFGTRIRAIADFESYVTDAQEAYEHALATFEAYGPSVFTQDAIEDVEVVKLLMEKIFYIGGRLRTIIETHETIEGMSSAGEAAISAILKVQEAATKNEVLVARIEAAVRILLASEANEFSDVSDKTEAKNSLMILLSVADSIKRLESDETRPVEHLPLAEAGGWEQEEGVRILRAVWKNTADVVASSLVRSSGPLNTRTPQKMKQGQKRSSVSAKDVIELTAAFVKGVLGLEIRLEENAFSVDSYSYAFNVFDESLLIGTVYLRFNAHSGAGGLRYKDSPQWLSGDAVPSVVCYIPTEYAEISTEDRAVSAEGPAFSSSLTLGSSAGSSRSLLSQSQTLQAIRLGEMSQYVFSYFVKSIVEFLAMRDPAHYYRPAFIRADGKMERTASNAYFLQLFTDRLVDLFARDLQEADAGVAFEQVRQPRQAVGFEWWNFFESIEAAAGVTAARVGLGSPELARVLDTAADHTVLQRLKSYRGGLLLGKRYSLSSNGHIEALSSAMAAMAYQTNGFRETLFELHRSLTGSLQAAASTLTFMGRSDCPHVCDAANRLIAGPTPNLERLREFLNPRLRRGTPQSVAILLPELGDRIANGNVEDSVDYAPLILEILPRIEA